MYGKKYNIENCYEYDYVFKSKDIELKCFSKKFMKKQYKENSYTLVGEYRKSKHKKVIGSFSNNDLENGEMYLFQYKSFNRFFYKEVGYLKVKDENDTFIVLIKHRLLLPPFFLGATALILFFGFYFLGVTPNTINKDNIVEVTPTPTPAPTEERYFKPTVTNVDYTTNKAVDDFMYLPYLYFYGGTASNGDAGIVVNNNKDIYKLVHYILNDGTEIATSRMIEPGETLMSITLNSEGLKLGIGEWQGELRLESYMKNDKGEFRKTGEAKAFGRYFIEEL